MSYSGLQITRLGLCGVTRGLYGAFTKTEAPVTFPHNPGEITRLGLAGVPRGLYGSFTKAEAPDVATPDQPTGGWWFAYEQEMLRREAKRREREQKRAKAKALKDQVDRDIALEFRRQEEEAEREAELARLTRLAEEYQDQIKAQFGTRVTLAAARAITQGNFSAMEALEREMARAREEELFLINATMLILQ